MLLHKHCSVYVLHAFFLQLTGTRAQGAPSQGPVCSAGLAVVPSAVTLPSRLESGREAQDCPSHTKLSGCPGWGSQREGPGPHPQRLRDREVAGCPPGCRESPLSSRSCAGGKAWVCPFVFCSLGIIPRREIVGHMVKLGLISEQLSNCFRNRLHHFTFPSAMYDLIFPHPCQHLLLSFFNYRHPRTGEPSGLPSMGSHRVGHDWSDSAAAAAYYLIVVVMCIQRPKMVSVFSCGYWPFVDLLWRNIFTNPLPYFHCISLFSLLNWKFFSYILDTSPLSDKWAIFSRIVWVVFCFLATVLWQ